MLGVCCIGFSQVVVWEMLPEESGSGTRFLASRGLNGCLCSVGSSVASVWVLKLKVVGQSSFRLTVKCLFSGTTFFSIYGNIYLGSRCIDLFIFCLLLYSLNITHWQLLHPFWLLIAWLLRSIALVWLLTHWTQWLLLSNLSSVYQPCSTTSFVNILCHFPVSFLILHNYTISFSHRLLNLICCHYSLSVSFTPIKPLSVVLFSQFIDLHL